MASKAAPSGKHAVVAQIERFNQGRDPERLTLKYKALRANAFSFLRGTCHLFWSEAPQSFWTSAEPLAWTCGDLHLENFGCYKGDDRLVYFDVNDFDEALAAPCYCDPVRLMSSIMVATKLLKVDETGARALCDGFLTAYARALQDGKARNIERETAQGLIRDLLDTAGRRKRAALLDSRTQNQGAKRKLRLDGKKALPADKTQRTKVEQLMAQFAARQKDPKFFRLLDVARRIAGTGSLGVERYVLLVEGKGSPHGNYLLDLKEARPSVLAPHVKARQPDWKSEADRVVSIQHRMQAVSPAFLRGVEMNGKPFVLRGLQPSEDRLNLADADGKLAKLQPIVAAMGSIVAWGQLRSSGWRGSAITEDLIAFGHAVESWRPALIELAQNFAKQVEADWRAFRDSPPPTDS
ncbi:MAG TPA: DUF2252 domain-containing protein [Burkholderiales bacterium]|nr:DUF2252 domain-containing protein [Burkholderiales bacterium]